MSTLHGTCMPYISTSRQLGESWTFKSWGVKTYVFESWTFNSPNLLKYGIGDQCYFSGFWKKVIVVAI
jgi:hypothetical protein